MLIWRIERDELGPFHHENDSITLDPDRHRHAFRLPAPDNDLGFHCRAERQMWHYACDSAEQLLLWFESVLDYLTERNFRVVVFSVPPHAVKLGTYQVAFQRSQAKPIKQLAPRMLKSPHLNKLTIKEFDA
jgi:hypothetical protein